MSKEAWLDTYKHSEESSRMIDGKPLPPITTWEARVRVLEAEGLTRSDAQGAVEAADREEKRQRRAWRNDSGV